MECPGTRSSNPLLQLCSPLTCPSSQPKQKAQCSYYGLSGSAILLLPVSSVASYHHPRAHLISLLFLENATCTLCSSLYYPLYLASHYLFSLRSLFQCHRFGEALPRALDNLPSSYIFCPEPAAMGLSTAQCIIYLFMHFPH